MLLFDAPAQRKKRYPSQKQILKELIPEITDKDITDITALAKELHGLYLAQCNRPITEIEEGRIAEIEEIDLKIFCIKYNISIAINSDPRGLPLRILNKKYQNTLDRDGYAILIGGF